MDKSVGINFNIENVRQLELLADSFEKLLLNRDLIETNFSLIILNIESFIPNSNIFDYIFKTDIFKREKLKLSINKEKQYDKIKKIDDDISDFVSEIDSLVRKIDELNIKIKDKEEELNEEYKIIDKMNSDMSNMDNNIDESEWKIYTGSSEEIFFNFLKKKLINQKKLIK